MGSTSQSSQLNCLKCGGLGHKSFECTNKKVMIVNANGDYEYMSEDEFHEMNKVECDTGDIYCDGESHQPSLVVTRVFTTNIQDGEEQ